MSNQGLGVAELGSHSILDTHNALVSIARLYCILKSACVWRVRSPSKQVLIFAYLVMGIAYISLAKCVINLVLP
jgi:hypothetical protein